MTADPAGDVGTQRQRDASRDGRSEKRNERCGDAARISKHPGRLSAVVLLLLFIALASTEPGLEAREIGVIPAAAFALPCLVPCYERALLVERLMECYDNFRLLGDSLQSSSLGPLTTNARCQHILTYAAAVASAHSFCPWRPPHQAMPIHPNLGSHARRFLSVCFLSRRPPAHFCCTRIHTPDIAPCSLHSSHRLALFSYPSRSGTSHDARFALLYTRPLLHRTTSSAPTLRLSFGATLAERSARPMYA
ncbi:hypothetical protein B0H13DRAFT_2357759 [Mycena leptocephala]|nr:hypothetical protein B0H13DRAFT_2357759 [Mycena leptocephala]